MNVVSFLVQEFYLEDRMKDAVDIHGKILITLLGY